MVVHESHSLFCCCMLLLLFFYYALMMKIEQTAFILHPQSYTISVDIFISSVSSGAGIAYAEGTLHDNVDAWSHIKLMPRVLVGPCPIATTAI